MKNDRTHMIPNCSRGLAEAPFESTLTQQKRARGQIDEPHTGLKENSKNLPTSELRTIDQAETSLVPRQVHDVLRSPGQPLDAQTRTFFESRFGHDFSKVRVHTDSRAADSAYAVAAQAYAVGDDIVFRGGKYAPGTVEGKQLLAHELAHVAQRAASNASAKAISSPNDAGEREAERVASRISSGWSATVMITPGAAYLQRQGDLTLTMPQLGAPRREYSLFPPGQEPRLHLDPWVQAYMLLDPDKIQRSFLDLNLNLSGVALPTPTGFQFPTTPPATPAPIVPPGAGPATPRAASVGDVLSALAAVPAVKNEITRLRDAASSQLRRDWRSLSTADKVVVVGGTALVAGGALAGIFANSSSRQFVLSQIQGKNIPVPFVPELSVQVNPIGPNQSVMFTLDLSALARKLGM